jgi:hypothetical protein
MDLAAALISSPEYIKYVNEYLDKLCEHLTGIKTYLDQPLADDNFNDADAADSLKSAKKGSG